MRRECGVVDRRSRLLHHCVLRCPLRRRGLGRPLHHRRDWGRDVGWDKWRSLWDWRNEIDDLRCSVLTQDADDGRDMRWAMRLLDRELCGNWLSVMCVLKARAMCNRWKRRSEKRTGRDEWDIRSMLLLVLLRGWHGWGICNWGGM